MTSAFRGGLVRPIRMLRFVRIRKGGMLECPPIFGFLTPWLLGSVYSKLQLHLELSPKKHSNLVTSIMNGPLPKYLVTEFRSAHLFYIYIQERKTMSRYQVKIRYYVNYSKLLFVDLWEHNGWGHGTTFNIYMPDFIKHKYSNNSNYEIQWHWTLTKYLYQGLHIFPYVNRPY